MCSVAQSCLTLHNPIGCTLPGSSVHGISQARILEWVAIFYPGDLPRRKIILTQGSNPSLHWQADSLPPAPPGSTEEKAKVRVAQSCLTLHNPMDCSPPGSSAHGIFQARVQEWGVIAFSEYSSRIQD